MLLLGRLYGGVHQEAWQWLLIAVIIWLGSTIFATRGRGGLPGSRRTGCSRSRCCCTSTFTIIGGIPVPDRRCAGHRQGHAHLRAIKISTDVIGNVSVPYGLVLGLVIWLAIFAGLATLSVRSMAEAV